MKFCETCGSILRTQKTDAGKYLLLCDKCGSSELINSEDVPEISFSDKIEHPEKGTSIPIEGDVPSYFTHVCKKCGYDKAQVIDLGNFYSDEDNLILVKCGKCGNVERIGRNAI